MIQGFDKFRLTLYTQHDSIILNFHEYTVTLLLRDDGRCRTQLHGQILQRVVGGNAMGQTGRNIYYHSTPPSRSAHRVRSVRSARKRAKRRVYALVAFILFFGLAVIFAYKPASAATKTLLQSFRVAEEQVPAPVVEAPAESIVQFQPAVEAPAAVSEFALRDTNALSINAWQGAKNCGESFEVSLNGVSATEPIQFNAKNCTVFPEAGTGADLYTVTVTGSGAYSLTATSGATSPLASDTRTGVAGRADQPALNISGWGRGDDYYDHFKIHVTGGEPRTDPSPSKQMDARLSLRLER